MYQSRYFAVEVELTDDSKSVETRTEKYVLKLILSPLDCRSHNAASMLNNVLCVHPVIL